MMKTAQIQQNYSRYGTRMGYLVFAVGFETFFAKNMKEAKNWCTSHGFEGIWVR